MTAETKPFWYFRPAAVDKTVVAADVVKKQVGFGEKVLFLAHRWELLDQAAKKIKTFAGIDSGFEKGEMSNLNGLFPVTVGSIQTLCRKARLEKFPRDYFQTLIVDEAHHSVSDSYQTVLDHFNSAKVLGMTASIDRADKRDLGEYYDSIAYEYSMRRAINDGYLVPIIAKMIPLELNLRNVRVTNGDFNAEDTAHALEPYLEEIAAQMAIHCADRKTVVFLPLVRISQQFRDILERHGFSAVEVNGESPDRERKLKDFENGKYNILCNSALLIEGWDCPSVDCVVVLRPTKSRALYCLDEQTEILTEDGWKSDVEIGEKVAAFDKDTGEIKFVAALAKIRRPLNPDEFFISASGPSVNIRVTNHHRMLYDNKRRKGWKIKEAEDLANLKSGAYIPVAGNTVFKGVPLTDAELIFIGWVMTDGSINKCNGAIYITQSDHHKKYCEEIERCIIECGFKFTKSVMKRNGIKWRENGKCLVWSISKGKPRGRDKHLEGWGRLEKWISKDLSPALYDMTAEQFDVMLQAINHADGQKNQWISYHIGKGNKTFIERLQIMAIQRGYRASISIRKANSTRKSDMWVLHIKKQDYLTVGDTFDKHTWWVKEPHTDEMCWCVQNELGTLVTRRKGKVAIVGNCQMIGRGTRLLPGKDNLLVLDFLWQVEKHSLCGPSSLSDKEDKTREKIDEMIKEDEDGVDIFGVEDEAEKKVMDEEEAKRGSTLARQLEKVKGRKSKSVDPIQYAFSIAAEDLANFEPSFAWQMGPPTEKQISFLEGRGIDPNSVDNAGLASLLIDRLIMRQNEGLSTPKQIRVLERYGFRHVGTWSFESASHIIGMLASNHWRLPVGFNARTYIPA